MTAEEKKLTSWERSRLDSMPWDKWSERFGISENQIIEKGLGKDLAQAVLPTASRGTTSTRFPDRRSGNAWSSA